MDMDIMQAWAISFFNKDNELVGSFAIEKELEDHSIEAYAQSIMMDAFSVEEYEQIAYFKVEKHYLVIK